MGAPPGFVIAVRWAISIFRRIKHKHLKKGGGLNTGLVAYNCAKVSCGYPFSFVAKS